MRLILVFISTLLFIGVKCKTNVKSLTESLGQEVIEIGAPVKELPPDIEEEPAADDNDEKVTTTTTTIQPATKKEIKKLNITIGDTRRKNVKDVDKIDNVDDESKIEKELAEIYKDSADYKSDSSEEKDTTKVDISTVEEVKPIARAKEYFKFQPNLNNAKDVENFRTSVDEISCEKRATRKLEVGITPETKSAFRITVNIVLLAIVASITALCY